MIGLYNNLFLIKIKLFKLEWKINAFFRAERSSDRASCGWLEAENSARKHEKRDIPAT
jgi:hypothetical protein